MCMVDDSDGPVKHIDEGRYVRARKAHKCQECMRQIRPGERYHREVFLGDDRAPETWKTCEHCMVAREWLRCECGGWIYGGVEEDVAEHWHDGEGDDINLARMIVGMRRFWTTRRGDLMKLPQMPEMTP